MIINEKNNSNILKGTVKRGFNQTPRELKEKIFNEMRNTENPKPQEEKPVNNETMSPAQKLGKAFNNIKRMQ